MLSINEALKSIFGHDSFRPGQEEIIHSILMGDNALAILPTGAGKSLCYQIPAMVSGGFAIVISPLIALMKDQVDQLNKTINVAEFVNSTMDFREVEDVLRRLESGKIKLLYVAPERLENMQFANKIQSMHPEYVFVDEAHCISEWGHNFRPAYRKISEFIAHIGIKKVSAFTATATPEVIRDIATQLHLKNPRVFVRGFERDNLSISVTVTKNKRAKLIEILRQHGTPAIIYTASRKTTEEVNEFLQMNRFNSSYYHAGLHHIQRRNVQENFISGKLPIIVATNAFGMGIDKSDIRTVVHYNMPGSIENYYQEIGRAGRDGLPANTALLFEDRDEDIHRYFLLNSAPTKELVFALYDAICEYARVGHSGFIDDEIPLNYDYLRSVTRRPELTKALVHSVLSLLKEADYLAPVSEFSKKHEFRFSTDAGHLKKYVLTLTDDSKKLFILNLIRKFGDKAFTRKASFSPDYLSKDFGIEPENIEAYFKELNRSGFIEYSIPTFGEDTVRMLSARVQSRYLRIDFEKINRLFLHSKKKLGAIKEFVFTNNCRFAYILSYFGEDVKNYRCGKCDNCAAPSPVSDAGIQYLHEILLKTVYDFEKRLKKENIISIVRGTTKSPEFKNSSSYGVCANYPANELSTFLFNIEQQGYITTDAANGKKINVTNKAIEFLTERGLLQPAAANRDYEKDLELFHLLRDIRAKTAAKFNQAIYLVSTDEVLRNIALAKPKSKLELLAVEGFTERMFNKYGEDALECIRSFSGKKSTAAGGQQKDLPENVAETYRLIKEGYTLPEIAEIRRLSQPVVSMQIETIIEFDASIDVSKIVSDEVLKIVQHERSQGISDLKSLKKVVPASTGFPELRIALAKAKSSQF